MSRRGIVVFFGLVAALTSCRINRGDALPSLFLADALMPPMYTVSGTITQLAPAATGLVLENQGDRLTVAGGSASFTFPRAMHTDDLYVVQVLDYPATPYQLCTVSSGGTGTVGNSDISNVQVDCVNAKGLQVAVTSLAGSGLSLVNNGGDSLAINGPISSSTNFLFHTPVSAANPTYNVAVQNQPVSPWQTCTVTAGSGSASPFDGTIATGPIVDCTTNTYSVSATITGLNNSGLQLQFNAGAAQPVNAGTTSLSFGTLASGSSYDLTITQQPVGQNCAITGNTGVVDGSNITIPIACTLFGYSVGGTVTGLTGSGLSLSMAGSVSQTASISSGATGYFFPTSLNYNNTYNVSIATQPTGQFCTLSGPTSGTMAAASVTSLNVSCVPNNRLKVTVVSNAAATFSGSLTVGVTDGTSTWSYTTNSVGVGYLAPAAPPLLVSGTAYTVSLTNGSNQLCQAAPLSFAMPASDYDGVVVSCTATPLDSAGATYLNLTLPGLTMNGVGNDISVAAGSPISFTFNFAFSDSCNCDCTVPVVLAIYGATSTVAAGGGTAADGSKTCKKFWDGPKSIACSGGPFASYPLNKTWTSDGATSFLKAPTASGTYLVHYVAAHAFDCATDSTPFTTGLPVGIIRVP